MNVLQFTGILKIGLTVIMRILNYRYHRPDSICPFGVIEQYYKNEGRKVEVTDNEGVKHIGKLKNVTKGGFELETEIKSKGKAKELKDISFNFEQIKSTRVILTIK